MESGSGSHIQHAFGTALSEQLDEEVALAFVARIPIDQLVPLVDEAFDILLLIMVRIADFDRISPEILFRFFGCA
jgi:hypothetical protein